MAHYGQPSLLKLSNDALKWFYITVNNFPKNNISFVKDFYTLEGTILVFFCLL